MSSTGAAAAAATDPDVVGAQGNTQQHVWLHAERRVTQSELEACEAMNKYACAIFARACGLQLLDVAAVEGAAHTVCGMRGRSRVLSSAWLDARAARGGAELAEKLRNRHGIVREGTRRDYEMICAASGRQDDELLWYSDSTAVEGLLPYLVAADPALKKIVITVRCAPCFDGTGFSETAYAGAMSLWNPTVSGVASCRSLVISCLVLFVVRMQCTPRKLASICP